MDPFNQVKAEMDFIIGIQDYTFEVKIEEPAIETKPLSDWAIDLSQRCIEVHKNKFCCHQCDFSANRSFDLKMHLHIHIGEKSNNSYQKRYQRKHIKENEAFTNKTIFTKQQKIQSDVKTYQCSQCNKYFSTKGCLTRHQRIHTGEKPFQCSQCSKAFTQSSSLIEHQRIHTGEKPFQCSQCSKAFTQNSSLIKHQRVHTGDKPFQRSQCSKFSQKRVIL